MSLLTSIRSAVLGVVVIFSILALSLNASLLAFATFSGGDDDDDHSDLRHKIANFAGTGVGIAAFALLVVFPIMVINFLRQRSGAAMVLLEIGWVSILMILWVTAAGQATGSGIFSGGCSNADEDVQSLCTQYQALQGFEWLQFIILLIWLAVVMVVAAMAHFQGHTGVWLYPFCDAVVLCRRSSTNGPESKPPVEGMHTNVPPPPQVPALNVNTQITPQIHPSRIVPFTPTSSVPNPSQPPRYPSPVHRIPPPTLLSGDITHPNSHRPSFEQNSNRSSREQAVNTVITPDLPPVPQPDYRPLPLQPIDQPNFRPLPPQPVYTPLTEDQIVISKLPQV